MIDLKRITLMCGHYGSGKTNVAVNFAVKSKQQGKKVVIADLDIVNPYFRTKDFEDVLVQNDIPLICSKYAGSNVDTPALPSEMYRIVEDFDSDYIVDVGGDDRGSLALGRLTKQILAENNYEMYMVVNKFRPLTTTVADTLEVKQEIECSCGIPFTGIINNSNLGLSTTAEDVLSTLEYAEQLSRQANLPLVCTTVREGLYDSLKDKIENLISIKI